MYFARYWINLLNFVQANKDCDHYNGYLVERWLILSMKNFLLVCARVSGFIAAFILIASVSISTQSGGTGTTLLAISISGLLLIVSLIYQRVRQSPSTPEPPRRKSTSEQTIRILTPEPPIRIPNPPAFKTSLIYILNQLDVMDGIQFEHYVAHLLTLHGYKTEITKASGDYGIDVIATKDGIKFGVQVKRYTGRVSRTAISDAVAGSLHWRCDKSMVVTNSYFTDSAKKLADSTGCVLVDKTLLKRWIVDSKAKKT